MKDESKGKIITEFIGLNSNMCSLVAVDYEEVKKAKGVNKNIVRKIRHKEFADALFNKKITRHEIKRNQSKLCNIGTYDVCMISLSFFYDKRYILDDGIDSFAYFHKDIKTQ